MSEVIYISDLKEQLYQIGDIGVDCGRILIGDPSNNILNIRTTKGDGVYPVYATDKGRIVIDFMPYHALDDTNEREWAEKYHDCTEIEEWKI